MCVQVPGLGRGASEAPRVSHCPYCPYCPHLLLVSVQHTAGLAAAQHPQQVPTARRRASDHQVPPRPRFDGSGARMPLRLTGPQSSIKQNIHEAISPIRRHSHRAPRLRRTLSDGGGHGTTD